MSDVTLELRVGQRWRTRRTDPQEASDPSFTCGWATIARLDPDGVGFRAGEEMTGGVTIGNGNWLTTDAFRTNFPVFVGQMFEAEAQ